MGKKEGGENRLKKGKKERERERGGKNNTKDRSVLLIKMQMAAFY